MSDTSRVRCIYCLNPTAEITGKGLKCVHPYCKREWTFEYELNHYKDIQKRIGRNIVRAPKKEVPKSPHRRSSTKADGDKSKGDEE